MSLWSGRVVAADSKEPTFERDIRPILKANCFQCHGEQGKAESGLDLRLRRLAVAGGESGPAIVPGKPGESLLLAKLKAKEMPPGKDAKKLSAEQIASIEKWVAAGAPTARPEPDKIATGFVITDEDRQFWSFQPIRRPALPRPKQSGRVRNPIDAFLLQRLEERGASFSPEADQRTLLRRAYFDLVGLPPSPEEVDRFLADDAPGAYERLIDRLLDSPHYGERWGRHWLDVAGYADSDGYTVRDTIREYAYHYRDYVIRSLNADKPFDEFVREQLAGDEMVPPPRPSTNLTPDQVEKLAATGFLLMAPSGITGGADDPLAAYDDFTAETIKIVSSALLGLSAGCARCHDHRYDPISQEDYYRLRAVFEPAFQAFRTRSPRDRRVSLMTDDDRQAAQRIEAAAKKIDERKSATEAALIQQVLEKELARVPEKDRQAVREAHAVPPARRTPEQRKLLQAHPRVNNLNAQRLATYDRQAAADVQKIADEAAALRVTIPRETFLQPLTELPGTAPPTFLLARGDPRQPKGAMSPAELSILRSDGQAAIPADDPSLPTTGRRLAFARRLTDGSHPLLARVVVNRVWQHHFGSGLSGTKADFGTSGERPTHPELLDWLAWEFMDPSPQPSPPGGEGRVRGWSLKRLHRLIMTSTAYRQGLGNSELAIRNSESKAPIPHSAIRNPHSDDPENRLWGRRKARRLEAEVLRDAILAVSGKLNRKAFGPPVPVMPDPAGEIVIGVENTNAGIPGPVVPMLGEEFRRSIYIQARRSKPLTFLQTFDAPSMEPNCEARSQSTVAPQSLMLMNSRFVVEQSRYFAERVRREARPDLKSHVAHAWKLAFARAPTAEELADAASFLQARTEHFRAHPPAPPVADQGPVRRAAAKQRAGAVAPAPAAAPPDPEPEALAVLCQTLLSSNEFLYID